MNKNPHETAEAIKITRGSFKGGSILLVGIFIIGIIGLIVVNLGDFYINGYTSPWQLVTLIFALFFGIWIYFETNKMRSSRIILTPSSITHYLSDRKVEEIEFDPNVTLDVVTLKSFENDTHGPLAGYVIESTRREFISFKAVDGWEISDIRSLWDPLYSIIIENSVQMEDGLLKYIEYRAEKKLDQ